MTTALLTRGSIDVAHPAPMLRSHERLSRPADRSQVGHRGSRPDHWQVARLGDRHPWWSDRPHDAAAASATARRRDGASLDAALVERMGDLPAGPLRTITWDQGTAAGHLAIARSLEAGIYSCDSHAPWQRGSNENATDCSATTSPRVTT